MNPLRTIFSPKCVANHWPFLLVYSHQMAQKALKLKEPISSVLGCIVHEEITFLFLKNIGEKNINMI